MNSGPVRWRTGPESSCLALASVCDAKGEPADVAGRGGGRGHPRRPRAGRRSWSGRLPGRPRARPAAGRGHPGAARRRGRRVPRRGRHRPAGPARRGHPRPRRAGVPRHRRPGRRRGLPLQPAAAVPEPAEGAVRHLVLRAARRRHAATTPRLPDEDAAGADELWAPAVDLRYALRGGDVTPTSRRDGLPVRPPRRRLVPALGQRARRARQAHLARAVGLRAVPGAPPPGTASC